MALELRQQMIPHFEKIKSECETLLSKSMPKSSLQNSINYFLNHYDALILCTQHIDLELDNNNLEQNFRAYVIGRKTWYGSHSKQGAITSASLYSIVRSCIINNVNPRNYFPWVVQQIHQSKEILTPYEYSIKGTQ
jgi:transposase